MCGRGVASFTALDDHMMIHVCPGGCGEMFSNDKEIKKNHVFTTHGMKMTYNKKEERRNVSRKKKPYFNHMPLRRN